MDLRKVFACLSNDVRLSIYKTVDRYDEMNVTQIVDNFPHLSVSAVSQHLKVFRDAGLMVTRKEGQSVYYSLAVSSQYYKLKCLIQDIS